MNFIEKLKDWRNRLRDRHMFTIVITSFVVILILLGYIFKIRNDNRQALENRYNQAFFELATYVENIDTLLAKALVSKDPVHGAKTMSEIWRQSNLAKTNLTQLPIEQNLIAQTSKFLSQTSDFSHALTIQTIEQKSLTDNQLTQIKSLSDYASKLQDNISTLSAEIGQGRMYWNEIKKQGSATFSQINQEENASAFSQVADTFQDYPGLIYDGPFSDHITTLSPKGLTGNEITAEEAKNIAIEFIGKDNVNSTVSLTESNNSKIPCYSITLKLNNEDEVNMDISKKGGHVIWMLHNRDVSDKTLSINDAKIKAKEFLTARKINNMETTYYIEQNNIATINFAYKQDNVTVYSDLIKVSIALDNGEILGYEAAGYLFSHHTRNIATPKISEEQAKLLINQELNPKSSGLAIIPTELKTEVLVYEFTGKVNGRDFIVYINAETGNEEDILIIVNTPNGILTI